MSLQQGLQTLGEGNKAKTDRRINVDKYVNVTRRSLLVSGPGTKQSHTAHRKLLLQVRLDGPQPLENVFAWVHALAKITQVAKITSRWKPAVTSNLFATL